MDIRVYYELSQYLNTYTDENGEIHLGVYCGMQPEYIERMYIIGLREWFVVKYKGIEPLEAVPAHLMKMDYPALVVQFFDQVMVAFRDTHEISSLIIR